MKIKHYYEAKSQKELDYLLEYCKKAGCKLSQSNYNTDFELEYRFIGIYKCSNDIIALRGGGALEGKLTTDIEVFKAQFKNERTIEDIDKEVEALLKEKAELEAAQPLELIWKENGIHLGMLIPIQPWCNNGIWVQTTMFDMKTRELKDGTTIITLHKKLEQCN